MTVKSLLMALCQAHPTLTYQGFDPAGAVRSQRPAHAEFLAEREALLSASSEFIDVVAWLEKNSKQQTKTLNQLAHSYNWKHVAEKALGRYVSNGVFIAAALQVGLQVKHIEGTLNAHVNLSQDFLQVQRVVLTPCPL